MIKITGWGSILRLSFSLIYFWDVLGLSLFQWCSGVYRREQWWFMTAWFCSYCCECLVFYCCVEIRFIPTPLSWYIWLCRNLGKTWVHFEFGFITKEAFYSTYFLCTKSNMYIVCFWTEEWGYVCCTRWRTCGLILHPFALSDAGRNPLSGQMILKWEGFTDAILMPPTWSKCHRFSIVLISFDIYDLKNPAVWKELRL